MHGTCSFHLVSLIRDWCRLSPAKSCRISWVHYTELNTQILNELIQKIVVYEKTDNPDGSKSQRVDIHYKFIGYLEMKEMFGLPMVIPMEKDMEIDDALIAEAKELAKGFVG
ncbi:MAG: DUF4368 domain-containing protein [Desulfitobacteriaceae bacterium]|nr:DUF4368 domain-containing protein [Desulfitobacteriaceae bacterium]